MLLFKIYNYFKIKLHMFTIEQGNVERLASQVKKNCSEMGSVLL